MKQRQIEFDLAKGIAILAVIACHLDNYTLYGACTMMAIPLFFFVSGCFLSTKRSMSETIKNKFHQLIVPYMYICLIYLGLLAFKMLLEGQFSADYFWQSVLGAVYGCGNTLESPFYILKIGAIWFLLASFWGLILTRWMVEDPKHRMVILLALAFLAVYTARYFWLPFSIQAGCTAAVYSAAGFYWKKNGLDKINPADTGSILTFLVCLLVYIIGIYDYKGFHLVVCQFNNGILDLLCSFCAIYCGWYVSCLIAKSKKPRNILCRYLDWCGKNSLILLGCHFLELRLLPWDLILLSLLPFAYLSWQFLLVKFVLKVLLDSLLTLGFLKIRGLIKPRERKAA